mgnify:CR=1 FL=1
MVKTEKQVQVHAQVQATKVGYYVVPVETLTQVIYGQPISELPEYMLEELKKIYGEERAKHLDYALYRARNPVNGEVMAHIPGRVAYAALKQAAGIAGKPLKVNAELLGIYFPLNAVVYKVFHVDKPDKPSLTSAEVIPPMAKGVMVWLGDPSEIPSEFKAVREIQIGRWKKTGNGRIQINWV